MTLTNEQIETACEQAAQYFEEERYHFDTLEVTKNISNKEKLVLIFNLYSAPHSLTFCGTFKGCINHINEKTNWHGYDSECFNNEDDLITAFKNNDYQGGWFIPTINMLKTFLEKKDERPIESTIIDGWLWSCTQHKHHWRDLMHPYQPDIPKVFAHENHIFNAHPVRAKLVSSKTVQHRRMILDDGHG